MKTDRPERCLTKIVLLLLYIAGVAVLPLVHILEAESRPPSVAHIEPLDFEDCRDHSSDGCTVCRSVSPQTLLPAAPGTSLTVASRSAQVAPAPESPASLRLHLLAQPRAPPYVA